MGTNYYLHLGKRSSAGAGNGCRFNQAVDLEAIARAVPSGTVQDEYGREMSLSEFLDMVGDDEKRTDSIGQRFS